LGNPSQGSRAKILCKDFAFPADLHLMAPANLRFSEANGPVDKPAKIARVELPCRAALTRLSGTVLNIPARARIAHFSLLYIQ
jgi:hypothetical protein